MNTPLKPKDRPPLGTPRPVDVHVGQAMFISLTKGYKTLVDADNFDELSRFSWCVSLARGVPYAVRGPLQHRGETKRIYMHRHIMTPEAGMFVDHANGDTLLNVRSNLRVCSRSDNQRNCVSRHGKSKFKGVSWHKVAGKWQVHISNSYLGLFVSEIEAAKAYDDAARNEFGKFAKLNFSCGVGP